MRKPVKFVDILNITEMSGKGQRSFTIHIIPVSEFAEIMGRNGEGDPLYIDYFERYSQNENCSDKVWDDVSVLFFHFRLLKKWIDPVSSKNAA